MPEVLVVPDDHPTIQAAVDAAYSGDTIEVRAGTYVEQVTILKNLRIVGAGATKTTVRAPATLTPNPRGDTAIVELRSGAHVEMSDLAVSGPGSGTCANGALRDGILVLANADLDLHDARVTDIHDKPFVECFRSGHGIRVGGPSTTATATIRHTVVERYQAVGIIVMGVGSFATIEDNIVAGAGPKRHLASGGIEMVIGGSAEVRGNAISGNTCGSRNLGCGPDFFEEFQVAGVSGGGPGTVIEGNVIFRNQVGIYVGEEAQIANNLLSNNDYFGIALQDGTFTLHGDRISGGHGGVAVVAASVDTHADLGDVVIQQISGPSFQLFECCGFTATVE